MLIIIMIRLQVGFSNLRPTNYQQELANEISLKFGPISTTITIVSEHGGKSLVLELPQDQMQQIYNLYACGLFLETKQGRYFSLLNLQKLKVNDKVICQEISFSNDLRQTKFKCQFSIVTTTYKSPKIANIAKIQERENVLNLLKKPPIPKQAQINNFIQSNKDQKVPTSFLYGGKQKQQEILSDNLATMKEDLRYQNQVRKNLKSSKNVNVVLPKEALTKKPEAFDQNCDFLDFCPPVMEFTNNEENNGQNFRVPQVEHIEFAESLEQQNKRNNTNLHMQSTEPKFATFNRNEGMNKREQTSPQTPSDFQLRNPDNPPLPPKAKALSKKQIKQMARRQAYQKMQINSKDKMCVPVVKGDEVEWVPLVKLKPQQIVDFVHKQRKNEQIAQENELRKQRLEQKQIELQERSRKLQLDMQRRERQRLSLERQASYQKKNSKEIKESVRQINEEESDEDEKIQEDQQYMSDFQSASVTGSIIKSRVSSRGATNYKNVVKEDESIVEDQYSAQFDSYSQSMLSKTNKNRNKAPSISDYSDSYRSISQSYRK